MSGWNEELQAIIDNARARYRELQVTVQADGSVVVPRELVAMLQLKPGQKCDMVSDGHGVRLRRPWKKPKPGTGARLVRRLTRVSGRAQDGMTTDELIKLMRGS
jgi:bifunctional DNA-binding transcriptional regulator/antitoxin component of YhaV-PrlF toxin-antitoxin module